MFRLLPLLIACASLGISPAEAADQQLNPPEAPAMPPVIPAVTGPSQVFFAQNQDALHGFDENPAVTRSMVDALVRSLVGKDDTTAAWRSLVSPSDRVGIKVSVAGGPLFGTRRGVVAALVAGLKDAGVRQIIIWDKSAEALKAAGFTPERMGCEVRGIDMPRGWDATNAIESPLVGKLIWGDLLFSNTLRERGADTTSSRSHLPTFFTKEITKFINVPTLSDDPGSGIAGAIHSATIGTMDNWRRFTIVDGAGMLLPDLYSDARIGGKCIFHLLDALTGTYAGGPGPNPQYTVTQGALYISKDPIAIDAIGLRLLEKWRIDAQLIPIGARAAWVKESTLGNSDPKMIQLKPAR